MLNKKIEYTQYRRKKTNQGQLFFMKKFTLSIFIFFVAFIDFANAGNRGYSVVFFDKSRVGEWKLLFKEYRKKYDPQIVDSCWSKRSGQWIDVAYVDKLPTGINKKLISGVQIKSSASIKKLGSILINYQDDLIESGFDGIYVAEVKNKSLVITGISSSGESVTIKENFPLTLKKLDLMLCRASQAFDSKFSP